MTTLSIMPEMLQQQMVDAVARHLLDKLNGHPTVDKLKGGKDQALSRLNEIDKHVDAVQLEANAKVLEIQTNANETVDKLQAEARAIVADLVAQAEGVLTAEGLGKLISGIRGDGADSSAASVEAKVLPADEGVLTLKDQLGKA